MRVLSAYKGATQTVALTLRQPPIALGILKVVIPSGLVPRISMLFPNDAIASLNDNAPTGFMPFSQTDSLLSQLQHSAPEPVNEHHLAILSDLHYQLGLDDFGRDSVSPPLVTQDIADPTSYQDQGFLEDISDSSRVETEVVETYPVTSGLDSGKAKATTEASPRKQKVNISYIDDNRKRQVSFCKRKNGAMKKGRELVRYPSTLHYLEKNSLDWKLICWDNRI